LGASVTFAAGEAIKDVRVTPVADAADEPDETVVVTLTPGQAFALGAPASATITIDDAPAPRPEQPGTLTWTRLADAPLGRSEANGAAVGGKLYLLSGYIDSTYRPTRQCDVYDPATNTWTRLADAPVGFTNAGVAADDRYIYLVGGYPEKPAPGTQFFATTTVYRYDTQNDTWRTIQSLPAARGSGSAVLVGRTLHYFGGSNADRQDRADHWSLDLDAPGATWVSRPAMPATRNHMGTAVVDGKIYVMAGQNGQDKGAIERSQCDVFDPELNGGAGGWYRIADLDPRRSHLAMSTVVFDGRIITMGGQGPDRSKIATVSSYDPATDTWTDLTPLPAIRKMGVGVVIGDAIYFTTGGYDGFNKTTWVGRFA
jgi:N-acetylneuraminic acid mutarotase